MPTPEDTPAPPELPAWFEQYRDLIQDTGGNTVEDLLHRLATTPKLAFSNIIVFSMALSVKAQVDLLRRLHHQDLLANTPAEILGGSVPTERDRFGHPIEQLDVRDEGPTPQQEMDWAIHNDHVDGA